MTVVTQNLCNSYLLEREFGVHVWGTDVMKLALYGAGVVLYPLTMTEYTAINEVVGEGYVAGGVVLGITAGFPMLAPSGNPKVLIDFVDILFNPADFTTRSALIYNSSKQNRAVATINFGLDYPANVSFAIVWPPNDEFNCIMRLGA
jgi:hypothetical protein